SLRRLTLALGLTANRASVTPTANAPNPVAPDSSTRGSAWARGHPNNTVTKKIKNPVMRFTAIVFPWHQMF
ncbi:MAG: hypothetical protein ACMG6S_31535, partial [Byssovorax sp.]